MCCLIKICKRLWDHKRQDMVYVNCDYASVKKEKAGAFVALTRKWEKLLFLRLSRTLPSFLRLCARCLVLAWFSWGRFCCFACADPLPSCCSSRQPHMGSILRAEIPLMPGSLGLRPITGKLRLRPASLMGHSFPSGKWWLIDWLLCINRALLLLLFSCYSICCGVFGRVGCLVCSGDGCAQLKGEVNFTSSALI